MGVIRSVVFVLLAGVAVGAGADDTDDGRAALKSKDGFLILPIETDVEIPKFKFEHSDSGSFTVSSVKAGRQTLFIRAKAGHYSLMRVSLGSNWFIEINHPNQSPAAVDIVAGAITYNGDLTMDRRGNSTSFRMGGCSIDMLKLLGRATPELDHAVFDRYPVADRAKECKPLDPAGGDQRSADGWAEAAQAHSSGHELSTLNGWLVKLGGKPIEIGQTAQTVWDSLDKLPADKVKRFRDAEQGSQAIWVRPEGRWGWKGMHAIYFVGLQDGQVAGASLRQFEQGTFHNPDADTRRDLEADFDATAAKP